MNILSFFHSKENCIEATGKLLLALNLKVTTTTLENDLYNHPDYPSLLSISDVLNGYGVENISIKSTTDKLTEMPMPCMVPIHGASNHSNLFTVIESINDNTIKYYDPEKYHWKEINKEDFAKKWASGIALLVEAGNAIGEKDYVHKCREEKRRNIAKYTSWSILPALAILAGILAFARYGLVAALPVAFSVITLMGSIAGSLLLWYELDAYNPVLQQICSAGKKVNCGAILNSKASKIAGISWSAIGFTYFSGALFTLMFTGISNTSTLFMLAWFNVLALPYVCFSIYYQWRIAKQWCILCLCVQGLLILQLLTALSAKWHSLDLLFNNDIIMPVLFAYTIPFMIVSLLLPAYRSAKESKRNKTELQRLKHNPQIFGTLLEKQKQVTTSTEGLGIRLGNPNATHKIIKVCNPYCGPCAEAHLPIEELLHSNHDIQVQIIFAATTETGDRRTAPVRHLLAIADKGIESLTRQALDDWYLTDKRDYEAFAAKYPMNGELELQNAKIEGMLAWNKQLDVSFTPTFFVNGYQLPDIYNVSDLKYFLSV